MVKLIRLAGNEEAFVLNAAQSRATVKLEPGDYKLIVYSGYTVVEANGGTHRAVFLHDSMPAPAQAAMNASVPRKSVLAATSATEILISTKRCRGCKLQDANLSSADLSGANLTEADLTGATLTGANLTHANLIGANLIGANLTRADLSRADLTRAKLYRADLSYAVLTRARLVDADLEGVNQRQIQTA